MARALIVLAVPYGFATLFGWLMQPGLMGPRFVPWYALLLPVVAGLASYFLGLAWMVRIYRADPEPDSRSWRYRNS
jgi:cytochrome c biogenesis protein CcdA